MPQNIRRSDGTCACEDEGKHSTLGPCPNQATEIRVDCDGDRWALCKDCMSTDHMADLWEAS